MMTTAKVREAHGMFPFDATGWAVEELVQKTVRECADLTRALGLWKK